MILVVSLSLYGEVSIFVVLRLSDFVFNVLLVIPLLSFKNISFRYVSLSTNQGSLQISDAVSLFSEETHIIFSSKHRAA